jgi:hypothetical protein
MSPNPHRILVGRAGAWQRESGHPVPWPVTRNSWDGRGTTVISWNCPKCGRWHELRSCDENIALARFAQLLSQVTESDEATRAADEDLQRYLGRTRRDRPAA